ncbi:MAG: hypothetical protein QW486_05680 [Candidatus Bathyarchaeia archaeon]|nr:hypothetical protein [Candidatus Bathyarchaeota archaeon]
MSTRLRRFIRRFRWKTGTVETLISVLVVVFTAFIAGGGIYNLIDRPPTIIGFSGGYVAVRGLQDEQTLMESALSMLFLTLTFLGLLTSYRSTRVVYDMRRASMTLFLGIALIALGLSGSFYLLSLKQMVLRQLGY